MSENNEFAAWKREMEMRVEALEKEVSEKAEFIASARAYVLKILIGVILFLGTYWAKAKGLL